MSDPFSPQDQAHMRQALALAAEGRFSSSPNPRVGCLIAHGSQIVGQGFHLRAGEPHAEVHALRQAGSAARGATAYVTLEPCAHHGRTPPCSAALIQAGVSRVVAAMRDPNPLVAGQGLAMLSAAGLQVACGLLEASARELNRGFLSRIERGRPYVILKTAASLDGKTALTDGRSQWITGAAARHDVQLLRAESCAVLTGIGTILADDPQLNVRAFAALRQPARIVLDSHARTPLGSRIIQDSGSATVLVHASNTTPKHTALPPHVSRLSTPADENGRIHLPALLPLLAQQGYGEILVEAGGTLNSAFLEQDWVDEIVLYQAPKILGHTGQSAFRLPENPQALNEAGWHSHSISPLGNDIKWVLTRG